MKTFDPQQATQRLDQLFTKRARQRPDRALDARISAPRLGLDYAFHAPAGGRPYHVASIGKLFTATLIFRLAERGALDVDEQVARYFSPVELAGLFVFKNCDYAGQVTIAQLLGHTSGIADYFEGKTRTGRAFIKDVLEQPNTHWTPLALVEFTRQNQAAVGTPGQRFNYSDTGYILLGQLIEKVTGKSFHEVLAEELFAPLGMDDSYLMFYGRPKNVPNVLGPISLGPNAFGPPPAIAPIWFKGVEISGFESLSCDWAGGGIISTTADLLKFSQALWAGRLVSRAALDRMAHCPHRFQPGIFYGLGMMEIRFRELFFLLGGLPRLKGHIGILATHLYYDPLHDAHIALNFGDAGRMVESFQALIEVMNVLGRA